jgi:hypothetical protein
MSTSPYDMARQMLVKDYARFCVEHKMKPSVQAAEFFAVKVTESGGKKYHDMTSDDLVKMLSADEAL